MLLISLLSATLSTAQVTQVPPIGQRTTDPARMAAEAGLGPDAGEDPAIAAAAAFPLGSAQNPVRVGGPEGERAYLARLRCADGSAPRIGPRADRGVGAFGSLVSGYTLECAGTSAVTVIMDMYHEEHRETRAPAGLSIQP